MNLSETQTRQDIIDGKLLDAGWDVNDPTKVTSEYFIPGQVKEKSAAYNSFEKSDYVILGQNGKPVAVVEAKKEESKILMTK